MSTRNWWLCGLHRAGIAVPQAQRGDAQPIPPPTPLATPVAKADARVMKLKETVSADVLANFKLGQEMVDSVFSFGELGFQEFETQRYLTGILKQNGFTIETGVAGIPTAWVARYGSGRPVIALDDVDGIPRRRRSPASPIATRSSLARPATAKVTTPERRSTSLPRWP